jgi:glycosyltransferase involved in cell wall biosynthesis
LLRVLVIIPFGGIFPPRTGGAIRAFNVLQQLARAHQVHAVLPPLSAGEQPGSFSLPNLTVHRPDSERTLDFPFNRIGAKAGAALQSRVLQRDWAHPASAYLLQTHSTIRKFLSESPVDVAIFTVAGSLPTASIVRRDSPSTLRVANTENIETALIRQRIGRAGLSGATVKALKQELGLASRYENHLSRYVHGFFAASEADKTELDRLNDFSLPGKIVPNGVDVSRKDYDNRTDKCDARSVIFCGSMDYEPNRDGLVWLLDVIWPLIKAQMPDARLRVVGRGADKALIDRLENEDSVDWIGEVEDVAPEYHQSGVCVVPLRLGSGTRLKVLEAMSFGNPVVSTSLGAEGIKAARDSELSIADVPSEFASLVVSLMKDKGRFDTIRRAARLRVERDYDWNGIGDEMNRTLIEWHDTFAARGRIG